MKMTEESLLKETYHPKAYLTKKRNVRLGLRARTRIISVLEKGARSARAVAQETGLSYDVVRHHLLLLEPENIVVRRARRPFSCELTGAGQQILTA